MKLFITGGTGYIGYSVVQDLVHQFKGSEIVLYDNLSRRNFSFFMNGEFKNTPIQFVQGDLLDSRKILKSMKGCDVVVHLAAKVSTPFADSDSHLYDQVNNWGSAQVALAAEQLPKVKQIIYLSSVSVYGSTIDSDFSPELPAPTSFYAISKLDGEKQMLRLAPKKQVYILRAGNVYGFNPVIRLDAVINRFVFEAHFQNRISIHGTGEQKRSFIHVDKLSDVILGAVQSKINPGTYNVCEHVFSINQVTDILKEVYPELEVISVNYNMPMRNISVAPSADLFNQVGARKASFIQEIEAMNKSFSF